MSTGPAMEMRIVKTGMASQALRDLHLLDNRLNLFNGWINATFRLRRFDTADSVRNH